MTQVAVSDRQSILHYALVRQLGAGGMGVVYRALDTRLDRAVALKFLPESLSVQPEAKRRLLLEAKAAAKLDHPNIGVIHGIEEADGLLFIVMALYEGQTLQDRLVHGPLDVAEAVGLGLQAARGLARAHDDGIVHRDVKPANLFLTGEGLLKILDFGLVKLDDVRGHTTAGAIVGTPEYMAPEQVRGRPADARADVWGLGVVLYEMLTGISPFRADGAVTATILRVVSTEPAPLAEARPGLAPALQDVVDRALAKDPEARYQDVHAFLAELEDLLLDMDGSGTATGPRVDAAAPTRGGRRTSGGQPGTSEAPTASVADLVLGGPGDAQVSPLLEPIPRTSGFIGRERELGDLRARLERQPMVAIRGMAGEGKSLLGARLARELQHEDRICWFTFDPIEKNTVDALFWSLAAFLAKRGEALLWRYLHGEIEAHRPLDRTVRLNLFLSSVEAAGCVFCFDDVHLVSDVPEVGELFKSLWRLSGSASQEQPARFVIMGRDLPREIEHLAEPLRGFTAAEVQALVEGHGLVLPAPLVAQLRDRTHGNPTLVELAVASMRRMEGDHAAMERFLDSMAGRGDIRDYVMNHMYADLSEGEKAVVNALSIFPVPVDMQLAEETLHESGLQGIGECMDSLIQKAIVREADARHVHCHALVRDFCQRSLDGRLKRSLHARAAGYYEAQNNVLRAAYHTLEQGEAERALALLTRNVRAIIDAGGAASLLELLVRFDVRDWDDAQRLAFVLLQGEALTVRGEYREAVSLYEAALDDVLDDEGRAELLSRLGTTGNYMGDHEQAIAYAMEGLEALASVDDDAATARLQRVLGMAHYRLGRLEDARTALQRGLVLAERCGDASLRAYLDQWLGVVDAREGRLEEARGRLETSRRAFRQLRDRTGEAVATGNLAMVYGMLGKADREHSLYLKVLDILEEVGDVGHLLILHNNLGDNQRRAGRFDEALAHYEKLVAIAGRIEHHRLLAEGYVGLAETLLASGKVEGARQYAEKAHALLQRMSAGAEPSIELAMSRRVLGEVCLALGDPAAARRWFEASIPPLEESPEVEELAKARRGYDAAVARAETPFSTEEGEWRDGSDVQT